MPQLPITVPPQFRIIAHRGASAYTPENTLAAFELAAAMGVYEIETDVQLTTDGVAVLCHDRTLARYGHGERVVEDLDWASLAELDMGSWFSPHLFGQARMLTLDQLFTHYADKFTYHVELKGHAAQLPTVTARSIAAHQLRNACIVTSFDYASLVSMRAADPDIRLGWLVHTLDDEALAKARALNLYQLCPRADQVTRESADRARTVVAEVRAWGLQGDTVSGQAREVQALIRNVLVANCDGMTINWPDWVRR